MLLLILILMLQLAWFEREQLVYTPEGRNLLEGLCRVTGCEPPARRDPDRFVILSRQIVARDDKPGTLDLRLVFANEAEYPQPYPRIRVSLLSPHGAVQAGRIFSPPEYLPPEHPPAESMPPRRPRRIDLDLVDPDTGWAGYRFDFL
jgi:hypothetical protein